MSLQDRIKMFEGLSQNTNSNTSQPKPVEVPKSTPPSSQFTQPKPVVPSQPSVTTTITSTNNKQGS